MDRRPKRTVAQNNVMTPSQTPNSRRLQASSNAGPTPKKRCLPAKQQIVIIEEDVICRWTKVQEEKNFSSDVDVATFLLSWYLDGVGGESKWESRCSHCQSSLTRYCQTCQLPVSPESNKRSATAKLSTVPASTSSGSTKVEALPVSFAEVGMSGTMLTVHDVGRKKHVGSDDDDDHDDDGNADYDTDNTDAQNVATGFYKTESVGDVSVVPPLDFNGVWSEFANTPSTSSCGLSNFVCSLCNLQFDQSKAHKHHMTQHKELYTVLQTGKIQCNSCPRIFPNFWKLWRHSVMQVGESECSQCKQIFTSRCQLTAHRKQHSQEKDKFKDKSSLKLAYKEKLKELQSRYCRTCDKTMTELSVADFAKHLLTHKDRKKDGKKMAEGEESDDAAGEDLDGGAADGPKDRSKSYVCPYCKLEFDNPAYHRKHMLTHKAQFANLENGGVRCKYCDCEFKNLQILYHHVRLLVGEATCADCRQEVVSHCQLSKHKREHKRDKARFCRWCKKSLRTMAYQEFCQHLLQHEKDEGNNGQTTYNPHSIVCSHCGKLYSNKNTLTSHIKKVHTKPATMFTCQFPDCGRQFKFETYLRRHYIIHEEKKEICEVCGCKFRRAVELRWHMQLHYGKKHECEQCHRRFMRYWHLKEHIDQVHKKVRRYTCSLCGKTYAAAASLAKHVKCSHSDERPHHCTECGTSFKTKFCLKKHMLGHSNIKPYQCFDCGVRYRDRTTFGLHRKKKHNDSLYLCPACPESFHVPSTLAFHMRMCHDTVPFDLEKARPTLVGPSGEDERAGALLSADLEGGRHFMAATSPHFIDTRSPNSSMSGAVTEGGMYLQ